MERRLAAIFAADMVGFSRLMEVDEIGTVTRQKRHRAELIDPKIEQHGGRIIKLTGDGMIAEFPSVVEAVQCAVSIQSEMAAREADVPDDRKIQYRTAVNLGDVIFDDEENDVYGDGVNIAARLEALAKPGGVVVSGTAYDHLKANVEVGYEDLGEQLVKNIATPVRVYRVVPDGQTAPQPARMPEKRRQPYVYPALAAAALMVTGLAVWQFAPWPTPAVKATLGDDQVLALPTGPKIVVLPFQNASGDTEQDFFVDGLTEDLTARLTDHGYLFVIGRTTAAKYGDASADVQKLGREAGVDYVVKGSIRRAGDRVRISVQVLSAEDGAQIWAQTFDRELTVDEIFEIQDEITISISESIAGTGGIVEKDLIADTGARKPKTLESYECVLLAQYYLENFIPAVHAKARDCLEKAVEREPNYAPAWARLSTIYRFEHAVGVNQLPDALDRSEAAVNQALRIDPRSPEALGAAAYLSLSRRRGEEALTYINRALELSPNLPYRIHASADMLTRLGEWERGAELWRKAAKFDPSPPSWALWAPMHYYHRRGDLLEAQKYLLRIKKSAGGWYLTTAWEAILFAEMDRMDEAREALARAIEQNPNMATMARLHLENWWWPQPEYLDRMMNGLYKAGLERPAEPTQ